MAKNRQDPKQLVELLLEPLGLPAFLPPPDAVRQAEPSPCAAAQARAAAL